MKSCLLSCILILGLSGCDLFNLSDQTDVISGRWSSNVVPQAGACCHLDLMLDSSKGDVVGSGTVATPGPRVGDANEYAIEVTGTITKERINLSLSSEYNPGTIVGTIIPDYNNTFDFVIRVNFSGFGYSGKDILLYPI